MKKKGKEFITTNNKKNIAKRFLRVIWFLLQSFVVFYLIKYAVRGVLRDVVPNNECYMDYVYGFSLHNVTSCSGVIRCINLFTFLFSAFYFIWLLGNTIKKEKTLTKNTKKLRTNNNKIVQYLRPVAVAIFILFLIKYAIMGIPFIPLSGYSCPMDWGPGSANWACQDALAKLEPHIMFVMVWFPAMVCSLIGFLVLFPKENKYYKLIRWIIICGIIVSCCYYLFADFGLIVNALTSNSGLFFRLWLLTL